MARGFTTMFSNGRINSNRTGNKASYMIIGITLDVFGMWIGGNKSFN